LKEGRIQNEIRNIEKYKIDLVQEQ